MRCVFLALVIAATGGAAKANHYAQQGYVDPYVVNAISFVISAIEQQCYLGNQASCQAHPYALQEAGILIEAGQICAASGNPQACQFYNMNTQQLFYVSNQIQQTQLGAQAAPLATGSSHADRMQQIHNWGQSMLQQGRVNSAILDQRHADFLANF